MTETIALLEEIATFGKVSHETLLEVECLFEVWQPIREETIHLMDSVANEIDSDTHDINKSSSAVNVATVGLGVVGMAAAPFTGGTSLVALTVASSMATRGASFGLRVALDNVINNNLQAVRRKAEEDKVATEKLLDCIRKLDDVIDGVEKIHKKIIAYRQIQATAAENISRNTHEPELLEDLEESVKAIDDFIKHVIVSKQVKIDPETARRLKVGLKAILRIPMIYATMRRTSSVRAIAITSIAASSFAAGGATLKFLGVGKAIATTCMGISVAIDAVETVITLQNACKKLETEEAKKLRESSCNLRKEKVNFDELYGKIKAQDSK